MRSVKFFGTSSAVTSAQRGFACIGIVSDGDGASANSQARRRTRRIVLLDCGDGSARRILQSGESVLSISDILISHFHSDHLSGLTQIIETMGIEKRRNDLNVFAPPGLEQYFSAVERTTNVASRREFKIRLNEVGASENFRVAGWSVRTFEMDHAIRCIGYRLEGANAEPSVAYTGDTVPCEGAMELGHAAGLLIHEATFLRQDIGKARDFKHSVPDEAAKTALDSGAAKLVLTHVNDARETPDEMMREAAPIFKNVSVAFDGASIPL
jgi:ribonuclease Z